MKIINSYRNKIYKLNMIRFIIKRKNKKNNITILLINRL